MRALKQDSIQLPTPFLLDRKPIIAQLSQSDDLIALRPLFMFKSFVSPFVIEYASSLFPKGKPDTGNYIVSCRISSNPLSINHQFQYRHWEIGK